MKLLKWTFIGIGSVIALVVIILVWAQFYINTDGMQQRIQAGVNAKIPGTITWRKGRISLLEGSAEWNDVMLKGPRNHTLIELSRLRLKVSWIGLLRGGLAVNDLYIEKPKIDLASDRFGNLNLIQAIYIARDHQSSAEERKSLPFNILIRKLEIVNGFFAYRTAGKGTGESADHVVFQHVNLTVKDGNLLKHNGRIDCRIVGGEVRVGGFLNTIEELSLMADVQKNRMVSLVLNIKTGGLSTHVFGNVEQLFTADPFLNLTIESRVSLSEIKDFVSIGSGFTGTVRMNSTVRGPLNNPNVELALDYEGGKLAGKQIDRIQVKCLLKDRYLSVNDANVYTPVGIFDLKGNVDFKNAFPDGWFRSHSAPDDIAYRLSIVQRNALLAHMPIKTSGLNGTIHGRIQIQGTGIHPKTLKAETDLELFVDKLSFGGDLSPIDVEVNARANMEKGRVTVHQLEVRSGKNQIKLNGSYDFASLRIDVDFGLAVPNLNGIAPYLGIKGTRGTIDIHGKVNGTVETIVVDARLRGGDLEFDNLRIGNAQADIRFSKGMLFLSHGKIFNGGSKLDIEGSARVFDPVDHRLWKPSNVDLSVKGDTLFLEDFIQEMKGKFALNGQIKGDVPQLQGSLNLKGKKLDLLIQKIDEVQLISTFDGDRIYFDPLNISFAPNENILLNGWISMGKDYDLNLTSKGISIKNITKLQAKGIDSGKISFSVSGKGGFENPNLKGTVLISDFRTNEKSLEDIQFQLEVKDQKAHISGGLNFALDTWYHLTTKDFSASVRFDNAVLTPYLKLAGGIELSGTATGKIEVNGNVEAPDRINGAADISQLALYWKQTELINARDLSLFFNNGELSTPGIRLFLLKHGHVEIDGAGKLNGDLDINAAGNIPLEIVPKLTNMISDAAGEVGFSLKIKGNRSQPAFFMDADLKEVEMTIPGQFQKIRDMNGRIRVMPGGVVLENIQGTIGTGKFELIGTVDLDGYHPSNMKFMLNVDDVPATIPDTLETRLSCTLNLSGTSKNASISGDIQLLEGTYYKDIQLNLMEKLGKPSRKAPLVTSKSRWPFLTAVLLDVKIRHREPFMVDNNVAVLSIKPDLRIYGSMNQPLISGRAEVESGTVYFQQKEFEIKKGVFDFINPYKIEPTIDIQSEVNIRKWSIFLNISGTPDTLKINMTSDPAENEKDIMSLLIAGKTTQELIEEEGGISTSPTQILANVLSKRLTKEVQDATGLDVFELEYQEVKNNEEANDVKVTVGKTLSRRVNVRYGIQTKNAKVVRQVFAEYKFLERLLMNTFHDTEGNFGGEFQFRLEFR